MGRRWRLVRPVPRLARRSGRPRAPARCVAWRRGSRRRAGRRVRAAAGAPPRWGWSGRVRPAVRRSGVSTHPRAYEVHVSLDGQKWGLPVASGKGAPGSTTIVLEQPVRARYIRITQTGTEDAPAWSVARLQVYGPPAPSSPAAKPSAP